MSGWPWTSRNAILFRKRSMFCIPTITILSQRRALAAVKSFKPKTEAEIATLIPKSVTAAMSGKYELFKTTAHFYNRPAPRLAVFSPSLRIQSIASQLPWSPAIARKESQAGRKYGISQNSIIDYAGYRHSCGNGHVLNLHPICAPNRRFCSLRIAPLKPGLDVRSVAHIHRLTGPWRART